MDATRQARRNLGGFTPEAVKEILELAQRPIETEVARLGRALSRCGAIDADDLRALGQIAALEAAKTFDPTRKATLRSWIGTQIRWKLGEAMKDAGDDASKEVALGLTGDLEFLVSVTEHPEHRRRYRVSDETTLVETESISESVAQTQARAWVLRSLAGLTPRQKILLVQRLANSEDCDDQTLGQTLGISASKVCRDFAVAIQRLSAARAWADRATTVATEEAACV